MTRKIYTTDLYEIQSELTGVSLLVDLVHEKHLEWAESYTKSDMTTFLWDFPKYTAVLGAVYANISSILEEIECTIEEETV